MHAYAAGLGRKSDSIREVHISVVVIFRNGSLFRMKHTHTHRREKSRNGNVHIET